MTTIIRLLTVAFVPVLLSGCVGPPFLDAYGYVSKDQDPVRKDGQPVVMPANAPSISQGFAPRPAKAMYSTRDKGRHEGIDILGPMGLAVFSCAPGTVVESRLDALLGHVVAVDHGRFKGKLYRSRYCHLQKRSVRVGDTVERCTRIGTLGRTGLLAGFPHLHFEIRTAAEKDQKVWVPVNPHLFWARGVGIVTCCEADKAWTKTEFRTTYPVPCRKE